jgi:hypothetical protein
MVGSIWMRQQQAKKRRKGDAERPAFDSRTTPDFLKAIKPKPKKKGKRK